MGHAAAPRAGPTGSLLSRRLRVAVVHPDDGDGDALVAHLRRMNLEVSRQWPPPAELDTGTDLVFLALHPEEREPPHAWATARHLPLVAVIGFENPTFIDHALALGARAFVTTPIRASGLLSAIIFAFQLSRQARQQDDRVERLEAKLRQVRVLGEAKNILMRMHGIGEAQAYDILRSQAMGRRTTVEDVAQSVIQAHELFATTAPRPDGAPRADGTR